MNEPIRLEWTDDHIGVVVFDDPQKEVNTIGLTFADCFRKIQQEIKEHSGLRGLLFRSAKPKSFVAGADIALVDSLRDAAEAEKASREFHAVLNWLEELTVPTVAAIHGPCLGGGLEFSLACRWRLVSDLKGTVLGLPEVKLGILPGAGGTQRLPRLIGLASGLEHITSGKSIYPRKAKKLGLADELVPHPLLHDRALEFIREIGNRPRPPRKRKWLDIFLESTVGSRLLEAQARQMILKQTGGLYPAPMEALDVVVRGFGRSMNEGLLFEAKAFGRLAASFESKGLIHLFKVTQALKKVSIDGALPISRLGVVGGGLMGAGIAGVAADSTDCQVRIREIDHAGIGRALNSVHSLIRGKVKKRIYKPTEGELILGRVSGGTDYTGFERAELVIEAVFEDLGLKRQIRADVEEAFGKNGNRTRIFATNTSSLPIATIAEGSSHPEHVVGMHFFSPVPKMPLLEVITTDQTSPEVTATAIDFGRKMGKQVIVVKDGPGFYTTRVVGFYCNEAFHLLAEGNTIEEIDQAARKIGFPVGPMTLSDEVGLDVGIKVGKILLDAFGERFAPPKGWESLATPKRLGKKTGRGLYRYKKGRRQASDPQIYQLLPGWQHTPSSQQAIGERLTYAFMAEAFRCYGEGIVPRPIEGDAGAVFGLGYLPFTGGPFHHADQIGLSTVHETFERLSQTVGDRFTTPEIVKILAGDGGSFYPKGSFD
ncbi:MAG: 3-hydroxyacyl-CoA dehydrogenase NAD-binding domain-containing protein [Planctomycetota bacterium]|jgi:3-hydroxyacyl-CoA dehydrogenase/enoyl-CoA hydratase/3-hydroxybutyryl-CoA epimerase|nr:3-hydroxyacyl-CoA dehydrogenase NAD-binding domain-containing protein [Planctomycetota bacterium]